MTCAQDAELAKSGSPIGLESPRPEPADYLIPLINALSAQTEALNRLAQSNEALVQAMAESDSDPDAEPTRYMDGTPIR